MESEKVKEIKELTNEQIIKSLETCIDFMRGRNKNACENCCFEKVADCGLVQAEHALTLINELEKENVNKTDTITDLLKKQKFYETEKLKRFAEKLKKKVVDKSENYVNQVVMATDIDETLKETLGEEK